MSNSEPCTCGRAIHPIAINRWLGGTLRRKLATAALGGREGRRARSRLERQLRLNEKVHGYKDPLARPERRRVDATVDFFRASCTGVTAVLRSWEEASKPLRESVVRFLGDLGTSVESGDTDGIFTNTWPLEHARVVAEQYLMAHPGAEVEEVIVMMGVVTGRLPVDGMADEERDVAMDSVVEARDPDGDGPDGATREWLVSHVPSEGRPGAGLCASMQGLEPLEDLLERFLAMRLLGALGVEE